MKYLILVFVLLSFGANAGTCDHAGGGYDEPTKSAMLVACLKSEAENTVEIAESILEDPDKVAEIAHKYASAVGIMAKEVGMATNEFMKTDAGKLATGAVVYTIFGEDIKRMIFGIPICIAIIFMWKGFTRKLISGEYEEVNNKKVFVNKPFGRMSEGEQFWYICTSLVAGAAIFLTLMTAYL